jgi:hypothetical protein
MNTQIRLDESQRILARFLYENYTTKGLAYPPIGYDYKKGTFLHRRLSADEITKLTKEFMRVRYKST